MGNALKGMIAGFVATLILSGLMLLNSTMDLMPQINIIRMLANLATLSTTAAWMDHFIVGVMIAITALVGLLILHLVYGVVLGAIYGFLGVWAPVKAAVNLPKEEVAITGPNPFTMNSADINDHLPSSSPSGKTVLIIFGCLGDSLRC